MLFRVKLRKKTFAKNYFVFVNYSITNLLDRNSEGLICKTVPP
jgi:hypothetical protein